MGGVLSYYNDVVYVSIFCQMLGSYTKYAWLVMLAIPGYAGYALLTNVLLPSWSTPEEIPESEVDRKRREKKERQGARAAKFQSVRR